MPVKIIYGSGTLGRMSAGEDEKTFAILKQYNIGEIDTATSYNTEGIIGQFDGAKHFTIQTKAGGFVPGSLSKADILAAMERSLTAMKVDKVETLYFHAPDSATPIEESLEAIQELHQAGKFDRFGLSNFPPELVQRVHTHCSSHSYVLPTIYQGNYNPVARHIETTLFPVLRSLGIAFYAYSPLAGGFLVKSPAALNTPMTGRWDQNGYVGKLYHGLYNKPTMLQGLALWEKTAKEAGLGQGEMALRWMRCHSALKGEHGDGMIVGASSSRQLEETLKWCERGPLPESVLTKIQEVWEVVKAEAPVDNFNG